MSNCQKIVNFVRPWLTEKRLTNAFPAPAELVNAPGCVERTRLTCMLRLLHPKFLARMRENIYIHI